MTSLQMHELQTLEDSAATASLRPSNGVNNVTCLSVLSFPSSSPRSQWRPSSRSMTSYAKTAPSVISFISTNKSDLKLTDVSAADDLTAADTDQQALHKSTTDSDQWFYLVASKQQLPAANIRQQSHYPAACYQQLISPSPLSLANTAAAGAPGKWILNAHCLHSTTTLLLPASSMVKNET